VEDKKHQTQLSFYRGSLGNKVIVTLTFTETEMLRKTSICLLNHRNMENKGQIKSISQLLENRYEYSG